MGWMVANWSKKTPDFRRKNLCDSFCHTTHLPPAKGTPIKVLVVDDEGDTVATQILLLRQSNYEAMGCTYAKDVMALIEEHRPEAVLLDLSMPGLSGFDIAEELSHHPDLKPRCLIAVTGYGQESDRKKTTATGFDYHLLKPLEWKALRTILDGCGAQRSEGART